MVNWQAICRYFKAGVARCYSRHCLFILVFLLLALELFTSTVYAESGELLEWPVLLQNTRKVNDYSKRSGLHLSVDTRWAGERGYRPVRLTLSTAKPSTADSQITIRFNVGSWRHLRKSITLEQDFEIHQGSTSTTVTIFVPQYNDWDLYHWEIWVDGKKDKELATQPMRFNLANTNNANDFIAKALILPTKTSGINLVQSLQIYSHGLIEAKLIDEDQIPNKWIGYTNFDIVVAKPNELVQWSQSSPQQFSELMRWVRSGGNLWVFDVGNEYSKIIDLESILQLKNDSNTSLIALSQRGWLALPLRGNIKSGVDALITLDGRLKPSPFSPQISLVSDKFNSAVRIIKSNQGNVNADTFKRILSSIASNYSLSTPQLSDSRDWFVARAHGMGSIVAFRKPYKQIRAEDASAISSLEHTLLQERVVWNKRHGNHPSHDNKDFNDLLIPDVGSAPVFQFQLLISLFVLGIGPLNYWLLKRRHQLPLLLLTVPLSAVATTIIVFAFGLFSDGIGVRVRARSMTLIDQVAGEATCWARTSYYAGIAPADGFRMPDNMAIYPISPYRPRNSFLGRQSVQDERELEWGEHQNLTRGWLASRTPTQYLTISSRASSKRLRLKPLQNKLSVSNELGVDIIWLGVQDHNGIIYLGENIEKDGTANLNAIKPTEAMSQLRTLVTDNVPELPAGFIVTQQQRNSWTNNQIPDSYRLSTNLMENQINSVVSPQLEGWGNGSYVAITSSGPELSLGIKDPIEVGSFHVVRGSWQNE